MFEVFGDVLTETERDWIEFFECMGMLAPPADLEKREKLQKILLSHDGKRRAKHEGPLKLAALGVADHLWREEDRNPVLARSLLDPGDADCHCLDEDHPSRAAPGGAEGTFRLHFAATGLPAMEDLPMGCVLGTVVVEGCRAIDLEFVQELNEQEDAFGCYGPGRFAWFLREPEPLVTCSGSRRTGALELVSNKWVT